MDWQQSNTEDDDDEDEEEDDEFDAKSRSYREAIACKRDNHDEFHSSCISL